MARSYWLSAKLAELVLKVQNFSSKIGGYKVPLSWTDAQVTAAIALCDQIVSAINVTNQSRSAAKATTDWRGIILYGEPKGGEGPKPPVFPVIGADYQCGVVDLFVELRDQIVANSGYTLAMGEDLGLVGPESQGLVPSQTAPDLKVTVVGNVVTLTGSMQGLPVMRAEYAPKGGTYEMVAIITNLPVSFSIPLAAPGVPQVGTLKAIYVKKNADFGNYSPNYSLTLS